MDEREYLWTIKFRNNISQREIADKAQVDQSMVSYVLGGKRYSEPVVKAFLEYSPGDTMIYGILAKRAKRST